MNTTMPEASSTSLRMAVEAARAAAKTAEEIDRSDTGRSAPAHRRDVAAARN